MELSRPARDLERRSAGVVLYKHDCSVSGRDLVDPEYALAVFLTYLKNGRFQKIATVTVNIAHLGSRSFCRIGIPPAPCG